MNALLATGPFNYKLERTPIPQLPCNDNKLLIRVLFVGICGSDVKMYQGSSFYWSKHGRLNKNLLPIIPGHEFVGEVVDPGLNTQFQKGDLVVSEQMITCRAQGASLCWYCQQNLLNKCDRLKIYGQGMHGALAEYMVFHDPQLTYKVTGLTPLQAVLIEPIAVSVYAVQRAKQCVQQNQQNVQSVVVAGCGSIGLGVIAAIRELLGMDVCIIALDLVEHKIKFASSIGVQETMTLSPSLLGNPTAILESLRAKLPIDHPFHRRSGADIYFECSGSKHSPAQGIILLRKRGLFMHIGICRNDYEVTCAWNSISAGKELTILGSSLGHGGWDIAMNILRKGKLDGMITHQYALSEFEDAFQMAANNSASIKVVIDLSLPCLPPSPLLVPLIGNGPFAGKLAFVTGSSRGLGKAIARKLCSMGAWVIIHGTTEESPKSLNEDVLTMTQLAQKMTIDFGTQVLSVTGDLRKKDQLEIIKNKIKSFWNDTSIDFLICCAGGNIGKTVNTDSGGKPHSDDALHISQEELNEVLQRNLHTGIYSCQEFLPMMSTAGRVLLIGSVAGTCGRSGGAIYAVAKAALHEYARCLAEQVQSTGIRVNCLAPGQIETERYSRNIKGNLPKTIASSEQIADAVSLFCMNESSWIHGQVIRVDGGSQLFPC